MKKGILVSGVLPATRIPLFPAIGETTYICNMQVKNMHLLKTRASTKTSSFNPLTGSLVLLVRTLTFSIFI